MRRELRIERIAAVAAMLLVVGCGGRAAHDPGERGDGVIDVNGRLSRRGSSPFSLMLLRSAAGRTYMIQSSRLGDELRALDGMDVAVSGFLVPNDENVPVIAVRRYDVLRVPSGEKPLVGIVRASRAGNNAIWIVDDNDVQWNLRGDFREVLMSFVGAKVWVTGIVERSINVGQGSMRTILVTEYGVIRR
ncbi:MAG: hypothetical protein ACE5EO_02685 [Candidatus Krumholzibacteriia bacterium]